MTNLNGQTILITGASSGIGEACANAFAAQGARLLLVARRQAKLAALQPKLAKAGVKDLHLVALDVRDRTSVETTLAALPSSWKAIDVLVNCAGLSRGLDKLYEGSIEDWEEMIDTNIKGVLYVTRAIVPGMVQRGRGHIVNLGSTAGEITYPGGAVYCATKAAVNVINEGLREDLLGTGVRAVSIDPGMVKTEFSEVRFHGDTERAAKVYQGVIPLTPEDVADAIVWTVSRPAHVNIERVLMTSIDQANSLLFNRKT
jgi:3-hydroxy acid dehydrogenase / malonic semialdehyde reductase